MYQIVDLNFNLIFNKDLYIYTIYYIIYTLIFIFLKKKKIKNFFFF